MATGVTPVPPEAASCLCPHWRYRALSTCLSPVRAKHVPSFMDQEPWRKIHKERIHALGEVTNAEGYSPQDKNQARRGTFTHRK